MSYEPTNWKSGDTVTSAKLNKMEQGIANAGGGGGVLIVTADNDGVLDHTWNEIASNWAVLHYGTQYAPLVQVAEGDANYGVVFVSLGQQITPIIGTTDSADGYPVLQ